MSHSWGISGVGGGCDRCCASHTLVCTPVCRKLGKALSHWGGHGLGVCIICFGMWMRAGEDAGMEARGCIVGIRPPIPPHGTWEFWELNSCRLAWPQRPSPAEASRWAKYVHFSLFFLPFYTLKIEPRGFHMLGNCSTI